MYAVLTSSSNIRYFSCAGFLTAVRPDNTLLSRLILVGLLFDGCMALQGKCSIVMTASLEPFSFLIETWLTEICNVIKIYPQNLNDICSPLIMLPSLC